MKYMSRQNSAVVIDIDIDIADILGQKYRYRIGISLGDIDLPPLCVVRFYRAMHMHKRGICRHAVSVRPSVCHVRELRQNEYRYLRNFFTMWQPNHSSFSTPNGVELFCPSVCLSRYCIKMTSHIIILLTVDQYDSYFPSTKHLMEISNGVTPAGASNADGV